MMMMDDGWSVDVDGWWLVARRVSFVGMSARRHTSQSQDLA
jgi:hypothetical protein